jgi:hypothetical protein
MNRVEKISAPGTKPSIQFRMEGANGYEVDSLSGELKIHSSLGSLIYKQAFAYEIDALGNLIPGSDFAMPYSMDSTGVIGLYSAGHNMSNALVVVMERMQPPVDIQHLGNPEWSTYFGGDGFDEGTAITHDEDGNPYFVGFTSSLIDFPIENGVISDYQGNVDCFISKFGSAHGASQGVVVDADRQLWTTYYGGSQLDRANSVSATGNGTSGSVFVTGQTFSSDFPTFISNGSGIYNQINYGGYSDAFIVKLNTYSGQPEWCSFFGGFGNEIGYSIIKDYNNQIYLGGSTNTQTYSSDVNDVPTDGGFPRFNTFSNYDNGGYKGVLDGFIAKFSNDGVCLWSSYFGGNDSDAVKAIDVNLTNELFFTGYTKSESNFPLLSSALSSTDYYQDTIGGNKDVFLAKFSNSGVQSYTSYFGGNGNEEGKTIVCDNLGNVYFAGLTSSNNPACNSCLCEVPPNGQFPLCLIGDSAYFQGNNGLGSYGGGAYDGFISKFDSLLNFKWGTYLGGNNFDEITSLSKDYADRIFFTGNTFSTNNIFEINGVNIIGPWIWTQFSHSNLSDGFFGFFDTLNIRKYSTYFGYSANDISTAILVYSTSETNHFWYTTGSTSFLPILMAHNDPDYCCPNAFIQYDPYNNTVDAFMTRSSWNTMFMVSVKNKENIYETDFLLYPNPTSNTITLELNQLDFKDNPRINLEIISINGSVIWKQELIVTDKYLRKELEVSGLQNGFYIIRIQNSSFVKSKKFIKY